MAKFNLRTYEKSVKNFIQDTKRLDIFDDKTYVSTEDGGWKALDDETDPFFSLDLNNFINWYDNDEQFNNIDGDERLKLEIIREFMYLIGQKVDYTTNDDIDLDIDVIIS